MLSRRPWWHYAIAVLVVIVLGGSVWLLASRDGGSDSNPPAAAPSTSAAAATTPAATEPATSPATDFGADAAADTSDGNVPEPAGTPDPKHPEWGTPTLVENLSTGNCLWAPTWDVSEKYGYTIGWVRCADEHAAEVYGVYEVPDQPYFGTDGQFTQGSPGDVSLNCPDPAAMKARHPDDTLRFQLYYPTKESWAKGARHAVCVASIDVPAGIKAFPGHL